MRGRQAGFALIELLAVVVIIGLLVSIAIPSYSKAIKRAEEAVLKEDLYILRNTINQYYADKGHYPESLRVLVEDRYLRSIPADPITGSAGTWQEIMADSDMLDPTEAPGVWDVKSGAKGSSLDGSFYQDW